MNNPHTRQIGGDHYVKLKLQPFQFTLANGWDSASHTILKYISRHHSIEREKAIESLKKALHIIEIRQAAIRQNNLFSILNPSPMYTMNEYCRVNDLGDLETAACLTLSLWVTDPKPLPDGPYHVLLWNRIEDILINRYGVGA